MGKKWIKFVLVVIFVILFLYIGLEIINAAMNALFAL
jgi:hypothetical protein